MEFKNKKNGHIYTVLEENVINTTNNVADENQKMVIYRKGDLIFCREEKEFYDKFTRVVPIGLKSSGIPWVSGGMD